MGNPLPTHTLPQDMDLQLETLSPLFADPQALPVSYTYNGKAHRGLPMGATRTQRLVDSNLVETVFTARVDDNLQIEVVCLTYRDYPVVEWTVFFTNGGSGNSAILTDVNAIDATFAGTDPVLVHNNGDYCNVDGYTVSYTALKDGTVFTQAPAGGRPCDKAFPYQRVLYPASGLNISIGWPGQWSCEYRGTKGGFTFKAGQQTVHTYLQPGETLRTPRMTLMAFVGDETRGMNLWRRWFNAHVTPKKHGNLLEPRAVVCETGGGIEFTKATEANLLPAIDYIKQNLPDASLWWIDAGWYPCAGEDALPHIWPKTGTWTADPARFPNGLAPVGKACKEAGLEFLVWWEPERVRAGTWLADNHPEWLLHAHKHEGVDTKNFMLNLANPEAHRWLREHVANYIRESGITCYRQDFNFEPLYYWRDNEAEDRKGMLENQYLQGYLAYWDYLLLNVPDLWIDSCASGGRRNDLETMRRSVPLHPTDYGYGYHHVNQAFRHTLCAWIPYVRAWSNSWDKDNVYLTTIDYYDPETSFDNFKMVNGMGCLYMVAVVSGLQKNEAALPYLRKLLPIWKRFADLQLRGDFYPLTENHRDFTRWTVFQYHLPEQDEGTFQVLRNNQARDETLTVKPAGLCDCATYLFENPETGETFTRSGADINRDGLTFRQPLRSGAIWFYTKKRVGRFEFRVEEVG